MNIIKKDGALLILRLTFGLSMLLAHGVPKLSNYSTMMNSFPDPLGIGNSLSLGLAIFAEVICATLLVLGLYTRIAALNLTITMLVAAFIFHASDPWSKMELGVLYASAYTALLLIGPGKISLDSLLRRKL